MATWDVILGDLSGGCSLSPVARVPRNFGWWRARKERFRPVAVRHVFGGGRAVYNYGNFRKLGTVRDGFSAPGRVAEFARIRAPELCEFRYAFRDWIEESWRDARK